MAIRQFVITELVSEVSDPSASATTAAPVKFTWDAKGHSVPAEGWEFGGQLRTVREDYPGNESEPVEQVLGSNFTPFTLKGVWDDKWNVVGFADDTWKSFEDLCRRGRPCQFQLEQILVVGLITDWKFHYRRYSRVEYQFTVSPHKRVTGTEPPPAVVQAPADHLKSMQQKAAAVRDAHSAMPAQALAGTLASDMDAAVNNVLTSVSVVASSIDNRYRVTTAVNGALRVVQAILAVRTVASLLARSAQAVDYTDLAYETPTGVMAFDVWRKGLNVAALQMAWDADQAARELQRTVSADALALYQPRAGESLYAISNLYFGTPLRWRDIAARNYLTQLVLDGTELLIIPSFV